VLCKAAVKPQVRVLQTTLVNEHILALDLEEAPVKAVFKQRFNRIWEEVDLVCDHPQDPACPGDRIIPDSCAVWGRGPHDDAPPYLKS
jgi:hypothetical protein